MPLMAPYIKIDYTHRNHIEELNFYGLVTALKKDVAAHEKALQLPPARMVAAVSWP